MAANGNVETMGNIMLPEGRDSPFERVLWMTMNVRLALSHLNPDGVCYGPLPPITHHSPRTHFAIFGSTLDELYIFFSSILCTLCSRSCYYYYYYDRTIQVMSNLIHGSWNGKCTWAIWLRPQKIPSKLQHHLCICIYSFDGKCVRVERTIQTQWNLWWRWWCFVSHALHFFFFFLIVSTLSATN